MTSYYNYDIVSTGEKVPLEYDWKDKVEEKKSKNNSGNNKHPQKAELSKEKLKRFNLVIRSLGTAIKDSLLYTPEHPVFNFAMKNLKTSLNKWFLDEGKMDLGISKDNLLLDGLYIKEEDTFYNEVADYLHSKGIITLSILKDIHIDELVEFFKFLKNDAKTIREKGGILKSIPSTPNLKIKEIDYSSLLGSAREQVTTEEKKIQQSLYSVAEESKKGKLPESKLEFLVDFLENPQRSASALNKLYKEAVAKLEGEETVKSIREAIARIREYFKKDTGENAKKLRADLAHVITRLNPDLVIRLFEQATIDGKNFDLAQEITKDFSDEFIAGFIESLVSGEGALNENLLKVFDKLTPGEDKAANIAPMIVDRLFGKGLLNVDTFSKLQESIKEIFKMHPDSNFMSEMYKMTVETFVDKKTGTPISAARLYPLVREFMKSTTEENQRKEKIRLLINIIWLEDDPSGFKKFSARLTDIFPEILDSKNTESIKEILELFTERLRPEQQKNIQINSELKAILAKIITREIIEKIISFIPEKDNKGLEEIVYILSKTKNNSADSLIDMFVSEKDPLRRYKFRSVISMMKGDISQEIARKMEDCHSSAARDLFEILKGTDPEKARLIAKRLIWHKDTQMRLEALEWFDPKTQDEKNSIFEIFKKEKNKEIQNKTLITLIKTKDKTIIDKLFKYTERSFFKSEFLLKLVELCGQLKMQETLPHLKRVLLKRLLFNTKKTDELRVASAVSLRQIGTAEAMELIKKGLNDKREPVRRTCNIIMELKRNEKEKPLKEGR
ncbi:MAG: hypothetical protein KAU58_01195 [Candidatus Omnitrophica bacterium]|nr:hypothetical protein [Candidatus Omnitrophota bacterium]